MKFTELSAELEKGLSPIYILIGGDAFLISKAISQFKKQINSEFENLNYSSFDEETFEINQVLSALQQLPFCSKTRLTIIRELSKINENEKSLLKSYSQNPNPENCLVIVDNNQVFSSLQNKIEVDCSSLSFALTQKLVASELKKRSKQITVDASEYLINTCDGNLSKLENEIIKLSFYTEDALIKKEDVENVVVKEDELEVFELSNALSKKDTSKAIELLQKMLLGKSEPSNLLALIYSSFRRMFFVSTSSLSTEELAKALKVKPYAIQKTKESLNLFSPKALKKIYALCEEVDYLNKSGGMDAVNCLYYLIFNIANI